MRLLALLVKEIWQHTGAVLASFVLLLGLWVMAMSFAFGTETSTLLTAATGFVYYGMPLAIFFVLRRLVVMEYDQHTHDFLAGLPVSAAAHAALKYSLGLLYAASIGVVVVLFTAFVSSRQELIPASFLAQVLVQVLAYTFAWHGITFFAAHLGRYRAAFWLIAIALAFTAEEINPDAWRDWLWHAALAEPLDVTRGNFPLGSILRSFGWGLAGTILGFGLAIWQQGAVVAGWFRPMMTHEKTLLVLLVVTSWLGAEFVDDVYEPGGKQYATLPDAAKNPAVVVRVGSGGERVAALAARLGDALVSVGDATGDPRWPEVILVPVLDEPEEAVAQRSKAHGELVLELDLTRSDHSLLLAMVQRVLHDRTAGLAALQPAAAWSLIGAPRWWLGADPERPEIYGLRAGYAASRVQVHELGDGVSLRQRLGPDVAAAVGWAGLVTLEARAGRAAVDAWLAGALARRGRENLLGALRARRGKVPDVLAQLAGEEAAFRGAWHAQLRAHEAEHAEALAAIRPAWGRLRRVDGEEADVVLVSEWGEAEIPAGTEIVWMSVDPLHRRPIYGDGVGDEARPIVVSTQRFPTPLDARRAVAAGFRTPVVAVDGALWSGLEVYE